MLREAIALKDRQSRLGETAATAADRKAYFLRQSGEVYAVCGQKEVALASYREAESIWKRTEETEPLYRVRSLVGLGGLFLNRGNLYAATRADWPEARNQYKKAIEIFAKLKSENQIGLPELREMVEAEQKLQALSN
jgi:tetratricopeptide (TPR) repeat protein